MSTKMLIALIFVFLIIAVTAGLVSITNSIEDLPNRSHQHETIVLGQKRFVPGSQAALRVVVRDSKDAAPLPNSQVAVSFQPTNGKSHRVFSGITDDQGAIDVSFAVPDDLGLNPNLVIETQSDLGTDTVQQNITMKRDQRVLLSTDKPLYQPGQIIHIRALALDTFDLLPVAGEDLEIVIADGKGNKVYQEKLTISAYGVVATDFVLASEVNTGAYKITATLGEVATEKTVTVEHYNLPKFDIEIHTEQPYYLPGEHVQGYLQAGYFFGKPVAGGNVLIEGYTFDVERTDVFSLQGTTDEEGNFEFEFDLPAYIAGSELDGGLGRFYLKASVIDQAAHTETSDLSFPVSENKLVIEAIPEGGQFRPEVENIFYVLSSYPDGTFAPTDLVIDFNTMGETFEVETDAYGLAAVHLTPNSARQSITITASDAFGNTASQQFAFDGQWMGETVLLRPDRPAYRVGESMNLSILTSQAQGTVYLDIVRGGQTISTRTIDVDDGQAQVAVDLSPDLFGTLELHAYKILRSGDIVRDTRLVIVDHATDLDLTLTPGQDVYRPGDLAALDIHVQGHDGTLAQAAVGLAIVDEAVFALAEQDPGFAKLYFMLESELLQPRYDLHGFDFGRMLADDDDLEPQLAQAYDGAAFASLAAAVPQAEFFSLFANTHQKVVQLIRTEQRQAFERLGNRLVVMASVLALAIAGWGLIILWQRSQLGRSFGVVLIAIVGMIVLSVFFPPLVFLFLGLGLLVFAIGLITLVSHVFEQRDGMLGGMLGLGALYAVVAFFLWSVSTNVNFDFGVEALGVLSLVIVFFSFCLQIIAFASRDKPPTSPSGMVLLLLVFLMVAGCSAPPPTEMTLTGGVEVMQEAEAMNMEGEAVVARTGSAAEAPRLRQYFPETMLWIPEAVTDENGDLQLEFPVADSITTWRMTALASTRDGRLGSTTAPLRVFQDFFIDLDLPLALTVGDEVSVPVAVFNYLETSQTVRLVLEQTGWFELLDEAEKEIEIEANQITVVYFRVRATQFGRQPFQVTAWGSQMSDAIRKEVRVFPDGKEIHFSSSDLLRAGDTIRQQTAIPAQAIPGTQNLIVKIYPGVLSQVVEGLDSILRMPNGCFEQTSSTTYPNVLVLEYLKVSGQISPEIQLKAEEYINLGYQRLTTFEVDSSGGFSLFGRAPADRMLTAYGLQEFSDMSRVHPVDSALIQRAAEWLFTQQAGDGSWKNDQGLVHEGTWAALGNDRLPVTAYIVWGLVEAGFATDGRTQLGVAYLQEHASEAKDAYSLALIANALVAADLSSNGQVGEFTTSVLDRLAELATREGETAAWQSQIATYMGSQGQVGSIETTALGALAFLRSGQDAELANAALIYLIQQKDNRGTWHTTQATILTLKALIESVRSGVENIDADVTVSLNDAETHRLQITPENYDVVHLVSFDDFITDAKNVVSIEVSGEGSLMYQVAGSYYLPWQAVSGSPQTGDTGGLMDIEVAYDRTELTVNDTVGVSVTVTLNQGYAESALIDLGLPPGFSVETEDLAALVAQFNQVPADYALPVIERFEVTGRQILIYVSNLSAEHPLTFGYRLRAKFPLAAQTPASNAYDYYNPDVNGEIAPQLLVVEP